MTVDLLVVDADSTRRRGLRELARRRGLRVCESDAAVEGVLLAREAKPAWVILDLMQPHGMEGHLATAMIRRAAGPRAKVLVVGARDDAARKRALAAGADGAFDQLDAEALLNSIASPIDALAGARRTSPSDLMRER